MFGNNSSATATWGGDVVASSPDTTIPAIQANGSSAINILGNIRGNNLAGGLLLRDNGVGNIYGNIWLTNSYLTKLRAAYGQFFQTATYGMPPKSMVAQSSWAPTTPFAQPVLWRWVKATPTLFFRHEWLQPASARGHQQHRQHVNLFTNSSANPSVFTVNATNANSRIAASGAGNIIVGGLISFVKNGSFQLALGGANTYTGTNTINGGTLLITNAGTLGNVANPLFLNAGTLNLGGSSQTVGDVTIASGTITNGTLTANSYTVQSATIYAALGGSAVLEQFDQNFRHVDPCRSEYLQRRDHRHWRQSHRRAPVVPAVVRSLSRRAQAWRRPTACWSQRMAANGLAPA